MAWSKRSRRAAAKRMRKRMADPEIRAATLANLATARERGDVRAAASVRMRDDDKLRAKCIRGQKKARQDPAYRAIQSAVMAEIMSRPEQRRRAKFHLIGVNKSAVSRRRQWATRRRKAAAREQAAMSTGERP